MKENVGRIDRLARTVIGPALVALGYTRLGARRGRLAGLLAIAAGAMIAESAITRVCPVNALIGLDTRSDAERERDLRALVSTAAADATRVVAEVSSITMAIAPT